MRRESDLIETSFFFYYFCPSFPFSELIFSTRQFVVFTLWCGSGYLVGSGSVFRIEVGSGSVLNVLLQNTSKIDLFNIHRLKNNKVLISQLYRKAKAMGEFFQVAFGSGSGLFFEGRIRILIFLVGRNRIKVFSRGSNPD